MYIYKDKVKVFGDHDENTLEQMLNCYNAGAVDAVLCSDGHLGYAQSIGGVTAYRNAVSISGIGYDQACGNMAIKTDIKYVDVILTIGNFVDQIVRDISFGVGRNNNTPIDHDLFDDEAWKLETLAPLKQMARNQLGTVGSGNHYVDVLVDEDSYVWIGVHFGSRGLGHKTTTAYLKAAGGKDGMMVDPTVVSLDTALGADYYTAMKLCGRYAYAGREYVARHVVKNILKGNIIEEIHNHHNYAWEEEHNGEKLIVVRKGATPAFVGQKGFIGGSMADNAVIVEGVDSELSKQALYSTVHGAGRIMSRTAAKGKVNRKTGEKISEGAISREAMDSWLKDFGVIVRGGDTDESPQAYRRLDDVLKHHEGTIKVLHTLKPVGVVMAGKDIFDPFSD